MKRSELRIRALFRKNCTITIIRADGEEVSVTFPPARRYEFVPDF